MPKCRTPAERRADRQVRGREAQRGAQHLSYGDLRQADRRLHQQQRGHGCQCRPARRWPRARRSWPSLPRGVRAWPFRGSPRRRRTRPGTPPTPDATGVGHHERARQTVVHPVDDRRVTAVDVPPDSPVSAGATGPPAACHRDSRSRCPCRERSSAPRRPSTVVSIVRPARGCACRPSGPRAPAAPRDIAPLNSAAAALVSSVPPRRMNGGFAHYSCATAHRDTMT